MGKLKNKLLVIFCIVCLFFMDSCNTVKLSSIRKYNRIENGYYQNYFNDSLKIAINFNGGHDYVSSFTTTKKKRMQIPQFSKATLRYYFNSLNVELFFISKSANNLPGFNYIYYGYISKKNFQFDSSKMSFFYTNNKNVKVYFGKALMRNKEITTFYAMPLEKCTLVFTCTKLSLKSNNSIDSFLLVANTYDQFRSFVTGNNYIKFKNSRDSVLEIIRNALSSKNYIKPIKQLENIDSTTILDEDIASDYYQPLLTRVSFTDDLQKLKELFNDYKTSIDRDQNTNNVVSLSEKIKIAGNALPYLLERAKENKVLMFNESHYDFRHRLLVNLLLQDLYTLGYRHLCLEDKDSSSSVDDVSKNAGYYILEPHMAELVRQAKRIGYDVHPFSYHSPDLTEKKFQSQVDQREYNQAYNLNKLYKSDTGSKWIILSGYDHINKRYFAKGQKSASQYFSDLSGVFPYTINQSYFSDIINTYVKPPLDSPAGYYYVDTACNIYKKKQADLYIINNIEVNPFKVPIYSGNDKLTKYDFSIPQINDAAYLFIYVKNEFDTLENSAIPLYIDNIKSGDNQTLYLPQTSNEYLGVITNDDENELYKWNLLH